MDKREISLMRSDELGKYNLNFEQARKHIQKGSDEICRARYEQQKQKILSLLNASQSDWDDWEWQLQNRMDNLSALEQIIDITPDEREAIAEVSNMHRWVLTPYYLALIDPADHNDPIRKMSVPSPYELDPNGLDDPMNEEFMNPAGVITRRYPDRLILNVTNACAMYCRHCQRRRKIGEYDHAADAGLITESIEFIRAHHEIRDVLITGGDPLTMPDSFLEDIISRIHAIPHVEMIRIGTRIPVTMPQRVTQGLAGMLRKYHPLYVNLQFNHPLELTPEAVAACARLADAGIPLGNQMVLLSGVNADKYIVRVLNHELLKARIRPYYIFHAKNVTGTLHFHTSIDEGLEIMERLRGYTSGMAIPTYIANAPGGLGKIPLLPDTVVERGDGFITLRTWEGKLVRYPNHRKPNE